MSKKKVVGGTGITAGGDVSIGDVSGQVAIGENIVQIINKDGSKSWLYTNGIRPATDPANIFGRQRELEEIDQRFKQSTALAITGFRDKPLLSDIKTHGAVIGNLGLVYNIIFQPSLFSNLHFPFTTNPLG